MRTKLFLSFIAVIFAALLSAILFKIMIVRDFNNYAAGVREDQVYWIISSVEGGYDNGKWNRQILAESIHWAMMMGLDIKILDAEGREAADSRHVMHSLPEGMKQRMEKLFHVRREAQGKYDEFPLYAQGRKTGSVMVRPFEKKELAEREAVFKTRTRYFLYLSLIIAGLGSVLTGLLLTYRLSKPVRLLRSASEKIAGGDFTVRLEAKSTDEIGGLARAFNRMAASLEKEEDIRKQLMSNIAHELRTPLTIMKNHVEAMTDGIVTDSQRGFETIEAEIERLIALVKGIEDITAAEAGFFAKGETQEIILRAFLSGIASDLLPSFRSKGLSIGLIGDDDLMVTVDSEKLERVLRNILSNALKFTDKGGVTISCGAEDSRFFIEVSDTGRGIAEEEQPLIFNRFYRSEGSDTEGLGLGLAIVKELVGVMEGRITVESRINKGSVFRVSLPLKA
ncbi:MAG: HAMP domain-containing sensor histidine kinase [Thermodesulfovibrionales bacterium]